MGFCESLLKLFIEKIWLSVFMGKREHFRKIFPDGKTVLIALDHGLEHGPSDFSAGNLDPRKIIKLLSPKANGFILQKGIAEIARRENILKCPLILKLTGRSSLSPNQFQAVVASVEDALRLKADAVAATVYVGEKEEARMLSQLGEIQSQACKAGLPLLAFMYPRGPGIKNPRDAGVIAYASRIGGELGADFVKTYYSGNTNSFRQVVLSCPVPVVAAGGKKVSSRKALEEVRSVMDAGAAGVAVGRNVWQNNNPVGMLEAVYSIVHKGYSVEKAMGFLKK